MSSVNQHTRLRILLSCGICAMAFGSSSALGDEIYSYTGPGYSPAQCDGTYVPNCSSFHLAGVFVTTLSLDELRNLTSYSMPVSDIVGFSFSDGSLTMSEADASVSRLAITTNGSGNIDWWSIEFTQPSGSFIGTYSCSAGTCPGGIIGGQDFSGTSGANSGGTIFEPLGQTWTGPEFVGTTTPEPSGSLLAGIGFTILVSFSVIRQQFRRPTSRG